jgi:hypothetical protein
MAGKTKKLSYVKLRPGDLITTDWDSGNQVYETYAINQPKHPIFRFNKDEIGMILEVDNDRTSPAIKIAVGGRIGWVNKNFFDRIK